MNDIHDVLKNISKKIGINIYARSVVRVISKYCVRIYTNEDLLLELLKSPLIWILFDRNIKTDYKYYFDKNYIEITLN